MSIWTPLAVTVAAVAVVIVVHRLAEPTVRGFGVSLTALYLGAAVIAASWLWWIVAGIPVWLGAFLGGT